MNERFPLVTNIQGYSIHDGPGIRTVVFLKGCPLACDWCANPENILPGPQIGFIENLCAKCGRCLAACPENTPEAIPEGFRIAGSRCTNCGTCADACYYKARVRYGKTMSPEEVFAEVRKDKIFYAKGGGGATVSGGEPLMWAPFVKALFELCKNDGIGTCVETSGFVGKEHFKSVLSVTDHVLFDLKHMDGKVHERYTGKGNELILVNAEEAAKSCANIVFRMPLVPSVNDSAENIRETAEFIKRACPGTELQLMPYHRLGESKYKALDTAWRFRHVPLPEEDHADRIRQTFAYYGIDCTISN